MKTDTDTTALLVMALEAFLDASDAGTKVEPGSPYYRLARKALKQAKGERMSPRTEDILLRVGAWLAKVGGIARW